jgi:endogenous inhibitor of DNA gyrase (YacG/DUF329 family)
MAMVQLKCPEAGEPIDVRDVAPEHALLPMAAVAWGTEVPCPHCGKGHLWTSSHMGQAMIALRDTPDATRVLVETTQDGPSATALA